MILTSVDCMPKLNLYISSNQDTQVNKGQPSVIYSVQLAAP